MYFVGPITEYYIHGMDIVCVSNNLIFLHLQNGRTK